MAARYIVILEVSQKQAYIFGHQRLQNNITASEIIRYVTNKKFFEKEAGDLFDEGKNLVYDGGGHTILEFPAENDAKEFVKRITKASLEQFPDIELFVKVVPYNDAITPAENEQNLIRELEIKKAKRNASFHQGKFGIEADIDYKGKRNEEKTLDKEREIVKSISEKSTINSEKYKAADEFGRLGGTKNESNFIAVVHIDGNLMGKRVSDLVEKDNRDDYNWDDYKKRKRAFSEAIDKDFKAAYKEMICTVEKNMPNLIEKLSLKKDNGNSDEKAYFPVRKIINSGDDVCFVTEGRIGIECAVAFLNAIRKKNNDVDNKPYSACAGIAIVHQKYPFYRAYDLAEELCSNAKKYIASLTDDGLADVCAIDWHIEYGEMSNGLSEIRKGYRNRDNVILGCRPYMVCGDDAIIEKDPVRKYECFKKLMNALLKKDDNIATGRLKNIRTALKGTKNDIRMYINFNLIKDFIEDVSYKYDAAWGEAPIYTLYDKEEHVLVFDAIELMDTFVSLED